MSLSITVVCGGAIQQNAELQVVCGGAVHSILRAIVGIGGTVQHGEQAGAVDVPVPTIGLEAIAHEIFNEVAIDPELFGELVTYTDSSGSQKVVYAIPLFDNQVVQERIDGRARTRFVRLFVSYAENTGISDPDRRGKFMLRGETFSIEDIGERQGGCWEMRLVRSERQEAAIGGFKRRGL